MSAIFREREVAPIAGIEYERPDDAGSPDFRRLLTGDFTPREMLLRGDLFDRMVRIAEMMATGKTTVPQHLRGNVGDCMAIVSQAMNWNMDPFAVAQKTHLVSGTLGYEAQLVAAVINSSGVTRDRFHFDWYGEWERVIGKFVEKESRKNPGETYRAPGWNLSDEKGLGLRVWATLRGENEPRVLDLLLTQAGVRNSTLWATDPKQQLAYLAQKRWARLFAPDVILGVYTRDELEGDERESDGMPSPPPPPKGPQRRSNAAVAPSPAPAANPTTPATAASHSQAPVAAAAAESAAPPPPASAGHDPTGEVIKPGEAAYLRSKIAAAGLDEATVLQRFNVPKLELFSKTQFDDLKSELLKVL